MRRALSDLKHYRESHKSLDLTSVTQEMREMLLNNYGFDAQDAEKLLFERSNRVEASELRKTMSDEFESWEKILSEKTMSVPLRLGTRIYSLPKSSYINIKKAWDKWK